MRSGTSWNILAASPYSAIRADDAPAWFNTALSIRPDRRTIVVEGVEIHYRLWRARSPTPPEQVQSDLILIHGAAAMSSWWDHIAPFLATSRRVLAIDLSGHGDSARRSEYSVQAWANEVRAVARDTGSTGAAIAIGHSLGGLVAMLAANAIEPGISAAIAIDSLIRDRTPAQHADSQARAARPLRVYPTQQAAEARFTPLPAHPVLAFVTAHIARESIMRVPSGWSWKFDPRIFARQQVVVDVARNPNRRVAIFRGEHGIVPSEVAARMRINFGLSDIVEIPEAGHHVMLDQPLALVTALRTVVTQWGI